MAVATLPARRETAARSAGAGPRETSRRIAGLDTIRFVCALWVVLGHADTSPLTGWVSPSTTLGRLVHAAYGLSFCGVAAVIVFFVISGFCIHLPYRDGTTPRWGHYYLRRYLRICVPLGAAIGLAYALDLGFNTLTGAVLWSIICEEIYYGIYPGLLFLKNRLGWPLFWSGAFVLALGVTLTGPGVMNYHGFGWQLTWLVGLPCWLLGCYLAENLDRLPAPPSAGTIWTWRPLVWAASVGCMALRFHAGVGYPLTLNWFAILVYFWLRREIAYYRARRAVPALEWGGKWSYSLYLVHSSAFALLAVLALPDLGSALNWLVRLVAVLGICYAFYLLVEKPSHALSRMIRTR